ncbi:hypothetical protein ACFQRL_12465 [Microbacterium fluvii]|uniref:DUF4430 domain-containing protein n=1 Tax=Microbacterium fluvii TaxID=415215 RepID=A0ABW2HIX5_9MICO|nr:hypothetical protein [Microbacterium fluvii]MCU4673410.1 hypothetical protein [Microbacterium fluvii]
MTSTPRILALAAAAALALSLAACSSTTTAQPGSSAAEETAAPTSAPCAGDEGVTFVVDSSALAGGADAQYCVPAEATIAAADVLAATGVETEGTDEYGDQVVCRVNGLPSATEPVGSTEDPAYVEECASMPAAFAYWSLWVKPAGGEWGYAEEGLSTLQVEPGDSLELLFTLDGEPAAPAS